MLSDFVNCYAYRSVVTSSFQLSVCLYIFGRTIFRFELRKSRGMTRWVKVTRVELTVYNTRSIARARFTQAQTRNI